MSYNTGRTYIHWTYHQRRRHITKFFDKK